MPEDVGHCLLRETGRRPERKSALEWRWRQHRVVVADGTTLTMPDTPANQAAYPQLKSQKKGCGFPIVRMVVMFSLAVGTVIERAMGGYECKQTGENRLQRMMRDHAKITKPEWQ